MSTGASNIANSATALKTASTATLTKSEQDRKTIAQNFDQFLSLLTTQLKNQSPLDPLDANQFTQQLVQFSGVEQQLKTNDLLTKMAQSFGGSGATGGKLTAASAAALIGTKVSVDASTTGVTQLTDGGYEAKWPVSVQSNYSNYQVSISDASGKKSTMRPGRRQEPASRHSHGQGRSQRRAQRSIRAHSTRSRFKAI
jgi:flagellar basal-body rod modification protein FlgD